MPANEISAYVVVAGFDFSPPSALALEEAIRIAAEHPNATLHVVHVASAHGGTIRLELEDESRSVSPEEAETLLASRVQAVLDQRRTTGLGAPKRFETRLRGGSVASDVVAFATELEADLIVIGTHGRTGVRRMLLGSVADVVVREAGCPVLVVRAKDYEEPAA